MVFDAISSNIDDVDAISSNIDDALSIKLPANVFVFGNFKGNFTPRWKYLCLIILFKEEYILKKNGFVFFH